MVDTLRAATVAMLESVRSEAEAVAILEAGSYDEGKHPRDDQGQWVTSGDMKLAMGNPKLALSLRSRVTNPKERAKLDRIIGVDPRKAGRRSQTVKMSRQVKPEKSSADAAQAARIARAKASHNPSSKDKQDISERMEIDVAKKLGAIKSGDNKPMDVIIGGKHGVEVKVLHDAKEGRVNMRPDSRKRKEEWAQTTGGTVHVLLIDNRDKFGGGSHASKYSGNKYYVAEGAKAHRLVSMTPVKSLAEAKAIITGGKR